MKKKSKKAERTLGARPSKEERLYQNILKTTQQYIQGRAFISMTAAEIFEKLQMAPQHQKIFEEVIHELVQMQCIEFINDHYRLKKRGLNIVPGLIHVHPRGFGFVRADDQELFSQDIFIPKQFMHRAVDGDRVEVEVNMELFSEKGPEGRVIAILSRGRTHVAGIIHSAAKGTPAQAYAPLLGSSETVLVEESEGEDPLQSGERVVMRVLEWGDKQNPTRCVVSHSLGHISDPSCDIKAAIEEYELRSDFPHQAIQEARAFGNKVSLKEIKNREDLRKLSCFTIDPDSAKDFDDAISLHKDESGGYHLGVHIADVSHYVRAGSALDEEAQKRSNSTYFPRYCLPMLPRELSDNLCSLKPGVNRLTASVFMDFDSEGKMVHYRISRSVIRSAKRFTYRQAKGILDGAIRSPYLPQLELMVELCRLLKRKRYERGSVEFSMPEVVIKIDEEGTPIGTEYIEYDITHQLVEEFMLKANETVAQHLSAQGKNLTYRVHEEPSEENLKDFSLLAAAFGFQLSEKPTSAEIQKLFDEAATTSYGPYLATSYIRRMRLAAYSADNIGHYGLCLSHYCHFTSPIRRYVDLVIHRVLFGESDERTHLDRIALHSSEQERISAKAENSVILLKKLRLLKQLHKDNPQNQYQAIVTRVKPFGVTFEILDLMLEGFLHVSELGNDYYRYEPALMKLSGVRTGEELRAGNRMIVMLKNVDLIFLESQWHYVGTPESSSNANSRRRRKGSPDKKGRGRRQQSTPSSPLVQQPTRDKPRRRKPKNK